MGGAHSDGQDAHIRELFRVVKVDKQGGCTFLEEKTSGREFMLKEFSTNDQKEFAKLQSALKQRQLNSHPQVLAVFDVYARTEDTLCSHAHKIFLIVEHPFRTLYEEVEERRKTRDFFTENEVWSIVYSCCLGLSHLYGKGYQHQALSSSRVYIESEGLIKISDPELMKQLNNLTAKNNASSEQHIYLSPEQIEAMEFGGAPKYSPVVSDVFTLGMVVLEAMQLDWMDAAYENGYVSSGKLHQILESVRDHYSKELRDVVARMIRLDPKERITLAEVEGIVESSNFEEERVDTTERRLDNVPSTTSVTHQVAPYQGAIDAEATKKFPSNQNELSSDSLQLTVKQNRTVNEKATPNDSDVKRSIEAVPSVLQPTERVVTKPLQSSKSGSNLAGRNLRLESNQFPKPSVSSGITSPTGGAYPAVKPDLKLGQNSLPSLLHTNQPTMYASPPTYVPFVQPMLPTRDIKQPFQNNKVLERNLVNASYETSSISGDSLMWVPTFMKENIGGHNYLNNTSYITSPPVQSMPFSSPYSGPSSLMYRKPSDPTEIYNRGNCDYAKMQHQPSLPTLNSTGTSMPQYLNNSFMSPSLMIGQFTFSTPTSISQSSFNMNPNNQPQPQYVQPITHTHTITFGDEKGQSEYDKLEAKMKELNEFALAPLDIGKVAVAPTNLPPSNPAPTVVQPTKLPSSDKPLADNTNRKSTEELKKPVVPLPEPAAAKPVNEEPKEAQKKTVPVKKPSTNSLKAAVVSEQQDNSLNPHDQALKELLQAIDNPTIPKYQSHLTTDTALYIKSQSKKNIALDVVEEKAEDEVTDSQKPSSPVSELQQFAQPGATASEKKETVKTSRELKRHFSEQEKSEKLGKTPISVTVSAVNGRAPTPALKETTSNYEATSSEHDSKSFKSSKQSVKQPITNEHPEQLPTPTSNEKVFSKPSRGRTQQRNTVPEKSSKPAANGLQVPLSKYHRDGSVSFGQESDSKESSQPPSARKPAHLEYDSQSGHDDSLEVPSSKDSKDSAHLLSLSNFSKSNMKAMPQYCHEDYEQGGWYEGYKLNGLRHGFGKLHYRDGGFYEGEWKENKMDGFAKLYYQNGEIAYEGYWRDDQFHGRGKVFNDSPQELTEPFNYHDFLELGNCWLYYDGMFDHDTRTGLGTLKLSNGEIFEGGFRNDYIEGAGKFYTMEGLVVDGVWKQSKLIA